MRELQSLLAERDKAIDSDHLQPTTIDFDHLKRRVRCYAHIINICSSHVVASITPTNSKSYFEYPIDSDLAPCDDSVSDNDSDDLDDDSDEADVQVPNLNDDRTKFKEWSAGIKRDPLRRARKVVRLLRSSDQRKQSFKNCIRDGNERDWFTVKDDKGKRAVVRVPDLQLLRDVKMRWDSVYMMLQRLRQLRPVSILLARQ